MVRGGKDGDLLNNDHSATSEGEEDLAHDQVTDGLVGLTKVDHESLTEHVEGYSPVQDPAESVGLLNSEANDEEPDARHNIEDGRDVTSNLKRLAAVDLQERGVVGEPAVVRNLVADIKRASAHHSARSQNLPLKERYRCQELLVETEGDDANDTQHKHGDDVILTPTVRRRTSEVEGDQGENKASKKEERAEN